MYKYVFSAVSLPALVNYTISGYAQYRLLYGFGEN